MRRSVLAFLPLVLALGSLAVAQTVSEAQMRAANMARTSAEVLNGGLSQYSPANCMHQGGGGSCLVSNSPEGFRFRFLGGPPGWASRNEKATIETVVLISPDAKVSRVEYNGPVRRNWNP
jgi:hypothetical protein